MERESTVILFVVLALLALGIVTVYSVSAVRPAGGSFFEHHVAYVCLGLAAMFVVSKIRYQWFCNPYFVGLLVIIALGLLVYVLVWGEPIRGARRWIRIGTFQFQPSEPAKIVLILFLAAKLSKSQTLVDNFWRGFIAPLVLPMVFAGLILAGPDLGVPIVIVATTFAMMYVAGVRFSYMLMSIGPVVAAVTFMIVTYPYRFERVLAWLDPWAYSRTKGFHLIQSLHAFARGSLWGTGPGAGEQKLQYLPDAHTDFIFAVLGEEMGLAGTLLTLALFFVLVVMAMRVAKCAPDLFGTLLTVGIIALIGFQALFNVAVTIGLLPTKGLPLPFISCGGTATLVFLLLVGILLNVASQAQEPERQLIHAY